MNHAAKLVVGCFACSLSAVAQENWVPVDGERVVMEVVDWVDVPVGGGIDNPSVTSRPVVDLSTVARRGAFEVSYDFLSDSIYCESRPDSRREYIIDDDSIRLLTTESYDIIIHEMTPPVWRTTVATRVGLLRRVLKHQREHFVGRGELWQGYPGNCDLILTPGDTLRDVRIHSVRMVCRYSPPKLIDEPAIDVPVDSSRVMIEDIHSWYVGGCRYPVVQSWSSRVEDLDGKELYCRMSSAVIEREYLDFLSEAVDADYPEGVYDAVYDRSRLTVDTSGGMVDIRYKSGGDGEIEMVLADIQGHVFAACPRRRVIAGEIYRFQVSRAALPPGDYLLYIYNGTESVTEKISLR